ncbi:aldo/keto reductase [Nocardia sp. NPDC050175]|uniref:aldo/keto reductase n=1 Tax=Nocardia sp. NPDC050175 TaxID=3364317 RepID=UPI0037A9E811
MDYTTLGNSGLRVSRIALGCMSYGDPNAGTHPWTLPESDAKPLLRAAYDAGINFFDTANIYSLGSSETIVGNAIREFGRDNIVLATKVYEPMNPKHPLSGGLSRHGIVHELHDSLRRLGTDHIDLYIIHRWDYHTPIEETMSTLNDLVHQGTVRYLGASSMYAWQFAKAQHTAVTNGLTPFISMQNHYNLIYREEEREMIPLCRDEGVGITPWSPLARGLLARRPDGEPTARTGQDPIQNRFYADTAETDVTIIDTVASIAAEIGTSMATVALAWLLHQPSVVAPIIGITRSRHLTDAVAALRTVLTSDHLDRLSRDYTPHAIAELPR